jgi:myo-inositol-1(or 4)-monophosphatase
MQSHLERATEIAKEAGQVLINYWGKLTNIRQKDYTWDLVTEADQESEDIILGRIKQWYPDHAILSEEAGEHLTDQSPYLWVVDPLDGTTNYTHQYPFVSISIALLHHGKPIVGVVYNPILQELFQAEQGKGAHLNGQSIHVSKIKNLNQCLLSTGFAYDRIDNPENNYSEFCHMTQVSQGVRRGGSAAIDLAYVAAGRLDGYWERGLNSWDIAAGVLLIEEAGGKVTSYEGDPVVLESGRLVSSNGLIHDDLISELVKKNRDPRL